MKSEESSTPAKRYQWFDSMRDRISAAGLSWVRQGLSTGKHALESGASTLSQTAGTLGELARKFERPAADAPEQKSTNGS
jgi:hypothetical protein